MPVGVENNTRDFPKMCHLFFLQIIWYTCYIKTTKRKSGAVITVFALDVCGQTKGNIGIPVMTAHGCRNPMFAPK